MKHSRIFALLLAVMMVFGCTSALADYPEKAIEVLIPPAPAVIPTPLFAPSPLP